MARPGERAMAEWWARICEGVVRRVAAALRAVIAQPSGLMLTGVGCLALVLSNRASRLATCAVYRLRQRRDIFPTGRLCLLHPGHPS
jgi:hypothetical protein